MAGGGIKQNNIIIRGGADGITPVFDISNGYLRVSYNKGTTWTQLGYVVGPEGPQGPAGSDGGNFSLDAEPGHLLIAGPNGEIVDAETDLSNAEVIFATYSYQAIEADHAQQADNAVLAQEAEYSRNGYYAESAGSAMLLNDGGGDVEEGSLTNPVYFVKGLPKPIDNTAFFNANIVKEQWTFTLEDGSTVTKKVHVG